MSNSSFDLTAALADVRQATDCLKAETPNSVALAVIGETIRQRQDDILEANTLDLEVSRDMALPELVVSWLKLTPERVQTIADIFHRLAAMGSAFPLPEGGTGTDGYYRAIPVGIVGFVHEAFPDLRAIAAGLCLRTGNALVLKGGSEASQTNEIISEILRSGLTEAGLPEKLVFSLDATDVSRTEMSQCPEIDLLIPHGRPSLVAKVVEEARVPVIPSRMGNCYLYWSASGTLDTVFRMILESHKGTPDAVNRIEKILMHESHSENTVTRLWTRLQEEGFELKADGAIAQSYSLETAELLDWGSAYLRKTLAFRQVKDCEEAMRWINTHSSGHADSIATEDYTESRRFMAGCASARVYINRTPQFVRNARQTGEIAIGVSDRKGVAGGLIGMAVMREHQRILHGS